MRENWEPCGWKRRRWLHRKTELALIVFASEDMEKELEWFRYFQEKNTPVIPVVSKSDLRSDEENQEFAEKLREQTKEKVCIVSAKTGAGIAELKERMIRMVPEASATGPLPGLWYPRETLSSW